MVRKKRIRSLTALSVRLGALILCLWFLCAAIMTYGTAQYIFADLVSAGFDFPEYAGRCGGLEFVYMYGSKTELQERKKIPGAIEYGMLESLASGGVTVSAPSFTGYPPENQWSIYCDQFATCSTAITFLDSEGKPLHQSGDFIYFPYVTEQGWSRAGKTMPTEGYGWIALSEESDERYRIFRTAYAEANSLYDYRALRLTGYFDGSRFEPYALAVIDDSAYHRALEAFAPEETSELHGEAGVSAFEVSDDGKTATVSASGTSHVPEHTLGMLDNMGLLEWDVQFDNASEAASELDLVTIYALSPEMELYDKGSRVRYREETHESLLDLLLSMDYYLDQGAAVFYQGASQFSLWNLIIFSERSFTDDSDWEPDEPYPEPDFTLMAAVQASPIRIAIRFLRNAYLLTGLLAIAGFLMLRRSMRKNLIHPLCQINQGIASGWVHLPALRDNAPKWSEPFELSEHYKITQNELRLSKNEITRLNTALEYAKAAEQNRRQMTSNIAHELKTPLAVIHSYAEGLKEHIAEDKRDKYIDVILSEAARTDGMVLEMLDLSRLEAGKVKLSRDDFSLPSLTRSIFDKLERAAQAKELQIEFLFPDDFTITADEGRMAQVIENFATNAVKYTPAGGHITVKIQNGRSDTLFSIENDSAPLSSEARSKIWDTFYRVDESRSGGGTGLGLAIARSIIELHGGRCSVRNTRSGVAFGFTIPHPM